MKRIRGFLADMWRPILLSVAALLLFTYLFAYKLANLQGNGVAMSEKATVLSATTVSQIGHNPLYLPYKVALYAINRAGFNGIAAQRAVSVFFTLAFLAVFYALLRNWYSRRVANISIVMIASTSWLLHVGRLTDPGILFLGIAACSALGLWLQRTKGTAAAMTLAIALGCLTLYIPGAIWFVVAICIWRGKRILAWARSFGKFPLIVWSFTALILLLPLIIAFGRDIHILRLWLGLPTPMPSPITLVKNLLLVPAAFFVRAPENPVFWLNRIPLLDIFTGTMVALGLYSYRYEISLERAKILFGGGALAVIVISLSNDLTHLTLLLPFVYLLVARGIYFMLNEWFTIFPRNPLARYFGLILVCTAVAFACFYNINRYMVAWAQAPETRASFNQTL